jgi:hypothetical protein
MKKYRNKSKHSTVVTFVCNAEHRVAEMKSRVVIYERNGRYYSRNSVEFYSKFEPVGDDSSGHDG